MEGAPGEADPLAAFGGRASLDAGIGRAGDALVFPPRAAWLRVRIDAAPGDYRLTIDTSAPALRVELETEAGAIPLPMVCRGTRQSVRFALTGRVARVRLLPVRARTVTVAAFALDAAEPAPSLLPPWALGPVRFPHHQELSAPQDAPPLTPATWSPQLSVDRRQNVSLDGRRFQSGPSGAVRLLMDPALPAGLHHLEGRFVGSEGEALRVAPRLYACDTPPNALPLAHFRRVAGSRYRAWVRLRAPAEALLLVPRQERGTVCVEGLAVTTPGRFGRLAAGLRVAVSVAADWLGARLERALGADPRGEGIGRRLLRLLTPADRRYRRRLRAEPEMVADWLARPVRRDGPLSIFVGPGREGARRRTIGSLPGGEVVTLTTGPEEADLILSAGSTLAPHALAALRRVPEGPVRFDTDRMIMGIRSAPRFRARPPGCNGTDREIPLVLVHEGGAVTRGATRVVPPVERPAVSIIVATRDAPEHLERFLKTLARTAGARPGLVLVDNGTSNSRALALLANAQAEGAVLLKDDRPFNFAALSNLGASHADGEILVFANNDLSFDEPDWLDALVGGLGEPDVGIAGARLSYPDGRIQHAGIVLAGEARVRHLERFAPGRDGGYLSRRRATTPVSAVTGALLAVRRRDFLSLGGFRDDRYPVLYNDVDLCLRANLAGLKTVLVGAAHAVHHESVTFGVRREADLFGRGGPLWRMERAVEADRFRQDWAHELDGDPYYPAQCDPVDAAFRAWA